MTIIDGNVESSNLRGAKKALGLVVQVCPHAHHKAVAKEFIGDGARGEC